MRAAADESSSRDLACRFRVRDGPILSQTRSRSKRPLPDQVADATKPRCQCDSWVERRPSRLAEKADRVEWRAANNILTVWSISRDLAPGPDCCRPRPAQLSLVPPPSRHTA